jgi:hypothetical protein
MCYLRFVFQIDSTILSISGQYNLFNELYFFFSLRKSLGNNLSRCWN